jgi:integrase
MIDGRAREMGLGSFPDVSLEEAREEARQKRKMIRRKPEHGGPVDPLDERQAAEIGAKTKAKAATFRQCATAFAKAQSNSWGSVKHTQQWLNSLEQHVFPQIGDVSADSIDSAAVAAVLEPIWHTMPVTAGRLRARIEKAFDYAIAAEHRSDNPAKLGVISILLGKQAHEVVHLRALGIDEMREFVAALRTRDTVVAACFEFAILTGTRNDEVRLARWDEIEGDTWVVSASRMKGRKGKRRPHAIPLSSAAKAIIERMQVIRDGHYIFAGFQKGRPLGKNALLDLRNQMGYREEMTTHGCRSTFSDWAGDRDDVEPEVAEMALAHKVGSAVRQAYRRSKAFEKRAALMQRWSDFLDGKSAEVVQLRAAGI